jgi:hypothetical protein
VTCSFVKGTFCNEKWRFPYPVVCELVPLYGSDGIWNKYNTIQYNKSMDSHNLETTQSNNLYTPQTNLSVYQKGAYYSGVKIFNKLLSNIKNVNG